MPGVSTKISWAAPLTVIPRIRRRVVWTLAVTIETLVPTRRLSSVDLPTLGAPRIAIKPQRRSACSATGGSGIGRCQARQQLLGGRLLGRPLGAGDGAARLEAGKRYRDVEAWRVRRPRHGGDLIGRQAKAAALGPFLQRSLGIARRHWHRLQPRQPMLPDEALGRDQAGIEVERADQGLDDIGEQSRVRAPAGFL